MSMMWARGRYLIVLITLCAGVMLTFVLFTMVRGWEWQQVEFEFKMLARDRTDIFIDKFDDNLEELYAVGSFYDASNKVERGEFGIFTQRILARHPEILAFAWMPRVTGDERQHLERAVREQGLPGFHITELDKNGRLVRAGQRELYFPILYVEPFEANTIIWGYDLFSDHVRRRAMEKACDTADQVATERIRLIREKGGKDAFRVFLPIYRKNSPHTTIDERRQNLVGFVSILVRMGATLELALKDLVPQGIDIYLYDVTKPWNEQLLYFCASRLHVSPVNKICREAKSFGGLQFVKSFALAGRRWSVVSRPCPEFYASYRLWQSWLVLAGGMLVTFLLVMYLSAILNRADKIKIQVDERTAELRISNQKLAVEIEEHARAHQMLAEARERLAVTIESIGDGVIATDTRGTVMLLNQVAQTFTGWSEKEALGRPIEKVFHIVNEQTRVRCPNPVERVLASGAIEGLGNHTVLIARDGSERILADSAAPIRGKHGAIIGVVLVFRDITEIRRIERDFQRSEIKYRTLYDSSADAIMLTTPERGFLAGNRATLSMFGCRSEEEFISQSPATLSPEYQPDGTLSSVKAQQMMAIAMEKGSHFFEWTHKRMDGKEFFATVLLTRMEIEGQRLLQATVRDITKRKKADEALRNSEARFRTLFDSAMEGILLADGETRQFFMCNKAMCQMLGYKEEELTRLNVKDIHPERDLPNVMEQFEKLIQEKIKVAPSLPVARKDGSIIHVDITAAPVILSGREYLMGMFHDITERKKAEDSLRASEARYRSYIEVTGQIGWTTSADGAVEDIPAWRKFTGQSIEEVKGWGWMHALHPDDIEITKQIWRKAVETKTSYETEYRIRRYDGVYRHFIARGIPMLNDDGSTREWVGTCIDITERKRMEESLARDADEIKRSAEEWLRTFDSISDFIFIQDQNYTITKVNSAFATLLKRDPDDLIGKKCYELLHGMDEPWPECPFEKSRKDGKPHTEVVEDPKIGIPLLVTTSPILDEQGRFMGSVHLAKDITQAMEAERKLKDAVEIKSDFVYMVSHELRTPLTAIKEGIGLVADGIAGKVNKKQGEFLGIAMRNVDRLARLINEVLDFQKMEAGKIEFDIRENDLNEAVREVHATMLPAAQEKGLKLAVRIDEKLPTVKFDRDSIVQVLINIIDNAIKYTEKGNIIVSTARKGNVATVMVQDTGTGINEEDIPKLFHSFERLSRGKYKKTDGTGLGLAISKQIIDAHKGKIWVESAPAAGSTFHFVLPIEERRG